MTPSIRKREESSSCVMPSCEVLLSDGKVWKLLLPAQRTVTQIEAQVDRFGSESITIKTEIGHCYPPQLQALFRDFLNACGSGVQTERFVSFRSFVIALVEQSYPVSREQAETLVQPSPALLADIARTLLPCLNSQSNTTKLKNCNFEHA